jgi:hypothetical protein
MKVAAIGLGGFSQPSWPSFQYFYTFPVYLRRKKDLLPFATVVGVVLLLLMLGPVLALP